MIFNVVGQHLRRQCHQCGVQRFIFNVSVYNYYDIVFSALNDILYYSVTGNNLITHHQILLALTARMF